MELQPLANLNNENIAPEHLKKVLEKRGEEQELKAAQDFESLFVQMSLKYMRPQHHDDKGYMNAGLAEDAFMQFFDEAIAKEIAKSPSSNFGIAEQVLKQNF